MNQVDGKVHFSYSGDQRQIFDPLDGGGGTLSHCYQAKQDEEEEEKAFAFVDTVGRPVEAKRGRTDTGTNRQTPSSLSLSLSLFPFFRSTDAEMFV